MRLNTRVLLGLFAISTLQAAARPPSAAGSGDPRAQEQGDPDTAAKKQGRLAGHPGAIAGIVIGSVLLAGAMSHGGGGGY